MKKVPAHERQRRVAATVPQFRYKRAPHGKVAVLCTRCGHSFIVNLKVWLQANDQPTRPCPFCFKVSRIHKTTKSSLEYH